MTSLFSPRTYLTLIYLEIDNVCVRISDHECASELLIPLSLTKSTVTTDSRNNLEMALNHEGNLCIEELQ